MSSNPGVTLQVNLAPSDVRYAAHTIPHQLRQWGGQVQEVLFTVDVHRSGWRKSTDPAARRELESLLEEMCGRHPNARFTYVDDSPGLIAEISAVYFGERRLPRKDFRGAPIYPYFYGLQTAAHDHVFHLDADMMFGGGSQTWMREAVQILEERPEVLTCSPLPGPPTRDGSLRSQTAEREPGPGPAYRFQHLSARLFVLDRRRLARHTRDVWLRLRRPLRSMLKGVALGHPPYEPAEDMLSRMMEEQGVYRIDFLGEAPGMWSVHPLNRTDLYYRLLPELIQAIEAGEVPEPQRGEHELQQETLMWLASRSRARPVEIELPPAPRMG